MSQRMEIYQVLYTQYLLVDTLSDGLSLYMRHVNKTDNTDNLYLCVNIRFWNNSGHGEQKVDLV